MVVLSTTNKKEGKEQSLWGDQIQSFALAMLNLNQQQDIHKELSKRQAKVLLWTGGRTGRSESCHHRADT